MKLHLARDTHPPITFTETPRQRICNLLRVHEEIMKSLRNARGKPVPLGGSVSLAGLCSGRLTQPKTQVRLLPFSPVLGAEKAIRLGGSVWISLPFQGLACPRGGSVVFHFSSTRSTELLVSTFDEIAFRQITCPTR